MFVFVPHNSCSAIVIVFNIFDVDSVSLYLICFNIASVLCFVFLSASMWELNSLTKDRTCTPGLGRGSVNHWTVREVAIVVNVMCASQNHSKCSVVEITLCRKLELFASIAASTLLCHPEPSSHLSQFKDFY